MSKILVVYYSHSGNTRKVAELIAAKTGGDLQEIVPVAAYPDSYNAVVEQAKKEIGAGFHPELRPPVADAAQYHTVFVGSPNWWSTIAPPIATFLAASDLAGKTVAPFLTHGGGGAGRLERDMAKLCPKAKVLEGLVVSGSGGSRAAATVASWVDGLGL